MSKTLSGKYSQKRLDHIKHFSADALKTNSKRVIQETAEVTGELTGNKIVDKVVKVSKISKIIQKQFQMCMIKKYLKKNIYLRKKDRKSLMIWD